jgi:hypothetical protein
MDGLQAAVSRAIAGFTRTQKQDGHEKHENEQCSQT